MGAMTFADIITEGLLLGGNDTLVTRAPIALKNWLRKEAVAWPWPQCIKLVSGLSLAANAGSVIVGAGVGGVTDIIHQVKKPVTLYSADYKRRSRPPIVQYDETHLGLSPVVAAGIQQYGIPQQVKVSPVYGVRGQFMLNFFPLPDQAYLMELLLHLIPADPVTTAAPWYPEDETMIEYVRTFVRKYDEDDDRIEAMQIVSSKVVDDRARHGGIPGYNEDLELDPSVFR